MIKNPQFYVSWTLILSFSAIYWAYLRFKKNATTELPKEIMEELKKLKLDD